MTKKVSRRDFLQLSTLAAAGTVLAACAQAATPQPAVEGSKSEEKPAEAPKSAGPVTITYLVRSDIGPKMDEWAAASVKDFQENNPDIKVEMVGVPWGDYNAKLLAMFAAGTPPEISANYAAGFATFYSNKAILPLDNYIQAESVDMSVIEKAAVDAVTREGQMWAFPLAHMATLLFYNRDMFDKAGLDPLSPDWADTSWNLERYLETVTKLAHDVDDPSKAEWGGVFGTGHLGVYCWRWGFDPLNGEGGPEMTEAYKTGKITETFFDSENFVKYMTWVSDLTLKGKTAPRPSDTDAITQAVGWPFMSSRIGTFIDGSWQVAAMANLKPNWKWAMAPLPYGPAGKNTTPLFNDSWMLSANSKNPDTGFKFLKYIAIDNGATLYAKIAGFFPANKKNYDVWYDATMAIPGFAMTRDELKTLTEGGFTHGFVTPGKTLNRFPELNTIFNQTTQPIFTGEAKVEDALKNTQAQFKTIISA